MSFRTIDAEDLRSLLKELLNRIENLERKRDLPPNYRIVEIDGDLYIENTITGELTPFGGECVCPPCGGPRIWRTTTTTPGSVTWIGESGEAAAVDASVASRLWEPAGLLWGPGTFHSFGVYTDDGGGGSLDLTGVGVVTVTARLSMWWTGPNTFDSAFEGATGDCDTTQQPQFYIYGDTISGLPGVWGGQGYWSSDVATSLGGGPWIPPANTLVMTESYADPDPNNDGDDSDADPGWADFSPPAAGLSDFATGWLRMTVDQATGDMTMELAADAGGSPGGWTTVATTTSADIDNSGPFNTYVEWNHWWNGGEPMNTGHVLHDFAIALDSNVELSFSAADTEQDMPITVRGGTGTYWPTGGAGNYNGGLIGGSGVNVDYYKPGRGTMFAAVPAVIIENVGGDYGTVGISADRTYPPDYTPGYPITGDPNVGSTTVPLWTDGPVLDDPLILWSDAGQPSIIYRITGVQPTSFYGVSEVDGLPITSPRTGPTAYGRGFCWGVADLGDPLVGPGFWAEGSIVQEPSPTV